MMRKKGQGRVGQGRAGQGKHEDENEDEDEEKMRRKYFTQRSVSCFIKENRYLQMHP